MRGVAHELAAGADLVADEFLRCRVEEARAAGACASENWPKPAKASTVATNDSLRSLAVRMSHFLGDEKSKRTTSRHARRQSRMGRVARAKRGSRCNRAYFSPLDWQVPMFQSH